MPVTLPSVDVEQDVRLALRWQVVLLNDDDHTYDSVIEMLMAVFQMTVEQAFHCACEVDKAGRSVVDVTSRERAELKQEQIHAFGPDLRIPRCKSSMGTVIEPVA